MNKKKVTKRSCVTVRLKKKVVLELKVNIRLTIES